MKCKICKIKMKKTEGKIHFNMGYMIPSLVIEQQYKCNSCYYTITIKESYDFMFKYRKKYKDIPFEGYSLSNLNIDDINRSINKT